jgi:hypothetical protein
MGGGRIGDQERSALLLWERGRSDPAPSFLSLPVEKAGSRKKNVAREGE